MKTSYIDMLAMVRAMGLADKTTLLASLEARVPGWLEAELDRGRGPRSWYNVPVVIMSQLLHPVSYFCPFQSYIIHLLKLFPYFSSTMMSMNFTMYFFFQAKYSNAIRKVREQKHSLLPMEYEMKYRDAFYKADSKSRKATLHAATIADPNLGEDWWRYL